MLGADEHRSVDELADAPEGLLDAERDREVVSHLSGCTDCRETFAALAEVSRVLAEAPVPVMPSAVVSRLGAVITAEVSQVAVAEEVSPAVGSDAQTPWPHRSLGSFGGPASKRTNLRWLTPLLVAAMCAAGVGLGGYVLSARAGLNEPPQLSAISSSELGVDARELERATDLDPHRFSQAWQCAREVTDGRITGLAYTVVDDKRALLVYTRAAGENLVTVITGCDSGTPVAGASATVRR